MDFFNVRKEFKKVYLKVNLKIIRFWSILNTLYFKGSSNYGQG